MGCVVSARDLTFSYNSREVLSHVSFKIETGDYVALAGPNGAGKTTLVKAVLGLLAGWQGEIELFGTPLADFKGWHLIGYLAQRANLLNPLFPATVKEVVGLGLLAQKTFPKIITRRDQNMIKEALNLLEIYHLTQKRISELSGGEQQRVFLARALVGRPRLLVLDEPTTALDPLVREQFFSILEGLNRNGVTIVIVTHDTAHIGQYASKLLYLDKRVIFFGGFAEFCHSEEMAKYFGPHSQHLICHQHD